MVVKVKAGKKRKNSLGHMLSASSVASMTIMQRSANRLNAIVMVISNI